MPKSIYERGRYIKSSSIIEQSFSDVVDLPLHAFRTFYVLANLANDYNEIPKLNISEVARLCGCPSHRDDIMKDLDILQERFFIKRKGKAAMISPVYMVRNWRYLEAVQEKWGNQW